MNYTTTKSILSLLHAGGLSGKNVFGLGRALHPRVNHRHVETACKTPPLRETVKSFGQPTHKTHPHRVKKGEVIPGIQLSELKIRRRKLIDGVADYCSEKMPDKAILVVVPSSQKKYMTEKIPYFFRQNSEFLYLTGCMEPDCVLVLIAEKEKRESVLFIRERDAHSELWEGPRTGVEEAIELFGVDKAMVMSDFEVFVQGFLARKKESIVWYDYNNNVYPSVHMFMHQVMPLTNNKIWGSPKPFVHKLRLIKSPAEQVLMKKSCEVASEAIRLTMRDTRPKDNEAFIQARVDFHCRMSGAEYLAYPPVVASGDRANIIHYINNDQLVEDGDLVLMDAGCEYHGYCSDITRTWPVSGKFTPAQRILYEVVLSVQTSLIDMCAEMPTLNQLYTEMGKLLAERLKESGVISTKLSEDESAACVSALCPHHVSHYLGMDVHDTTSIPRHIPVQPGMVITVEPGVYVRSDSKWTDPKFRGLGVRIEDDVLITDNGPEVLTSGCPKQPDDIETLIRR